MDHSWKQSEVFKKWRSTHPALPRNWRVHQCWAWERMERHWQTPLIWVKISDWWGACTQKTVLNFHMYKHFSYLLVNPYIRLTIKMCKTFNGDILVSDHWLTLTEMGLTFCSNHNMGSLLAWKCHTACQLNRFWQISSIYDPGESINTPIDALLAETRYQNLQSPRSPLKCTAYLIKDVIKQKRFGLIT